MTSVTHNGPVEPVKPGSAHGSSVTSDESPTNLVITSTDPVTGDPALIGTIDPYRTPLLTIFAATMGAISLDTDQGRRQVLDAIIATADSTAKFRDTLAIILGVASDAARHELEAMMGTAQYQTRLFDLAKAEEAARTKRENIFKVFESRGVQPTSEQHELVSSCTDLGQLDTWFDQALTASSTTEVFGGQS